jgi:hypothetical protein
MPDNSSKKISNRNLHKASQAKKDEFYTQLTDIENELKHYKDQFRDKVVFCNCDDPKESNFVKYFSMNFEHLGLKKLIATHYKEANLFTQQAPYKLEYAGNKKGNRMPDPSKFMTKMISDGDFRSQECIKLLKETDIVVTNPPFSLFREYVAQLMEYKKKFLIIGNVNAITYKESFKLVENNKVWLGVSIHSGDREFQVPDDYPLEAAGYRVDADGKKYIRVKGVRWFTNLDNKGRHENLVLYKKYSPKEYPKYDNYNAIEVSKVSEIPMDYDGIMGVPVTFLDKYNPKQFEILGITDRDIENKYRSKMYTRKDSPKYNDLNRRAAMKINREIIPVYARLLIKNKKPI